MYPFEIFVDPQRFHAAVVHLPVAMALLGIPLVYLTAVMSTDKETLRWLTLGMYVLMIPLALLGQWTGERAVEQVPPSLSAEVHDRIEQHEDMAEAVWMFAAATAVLLALSTLKVRWWRLGVMSLAMVASLLTGGWVSVTGHLGGRLVYEYGVGTPGRALNRPLPAPPAVTPPTIETPSETPPPVEPPVEQTLPVPEEMTPTAPPVEPTVVEPAPLAPPADTTPIPPEGALPSPPAGPGTAPLGDEPAPVDTGAPPGDFLPTVRPIVPEEAAKVSFARDVQPILVDHCIDCHDAEVRKGDLSMQTVADMMKPGLKSGPGVIPFKPDESSIVQYIRGLKQPQMPRKRDPLTEDQLHVIRMWIAAGAVDDTQPPAAPPAPDSGTPAPSHSRGDSLEAGGHGSGLLAAR